MILASKSPRRKELFSKISSDFKVITREIDEETVIKKYLNHDINSIDMIKKASQKLVEYKGDAVAKDYPNEMVIAADTMVVLDGRILGKPKDKIEAQKMLQSLLGKTHFVLTSFSLHYKNKSEVFSYLSEVEFYEDSKMMQEIIEDYIEKGEVFDKAGSYGIQDRGALFIKEIKGDFYSIMGLPIAKLNQEIWRIKNEK